MPADLDVHVVMDNYSVRKHPKVRAWFAKKPCYPEASHDLRVADG